MMQFSGTFVKNKFVRKHWCFHLFNPIAGFTNPQLFAWNRVIFEFWLPWRNHIYFFHVWRDSTLQFSHFRFVTLHLIVIKYFGIFPIFVVILCMYYVTCNKNPNEILPQWTNYAMCRTIFLFLCSRIWYLSFIHCK